MSSSVSPGFANNLPSTFGAGSLSIALIGPDKRRRNAVAVAIAEYRQANVSEFESYPTRTEEFRGLLEKSFDVIVFDLDSDPDVALELVEKIGTRGSATIMVYSEQANTKLAVRYMRAGAREFLLLPLEKGIVAEALDRAAANLCEKTQPARTTAGKLHVFVCAKGGSGVTTVACNLAIALAGNPDQKTLLIDLALPIGDAALALGIHAKYSTEDAIRNAERLDARLLNELLVRHRSGVFVLAAPSNIPEMEGCGDAIDKLIAVARREFDHVIVDVGSRMDLAGTAVFRQASTVYLVTLTGVSELRNSNRLISHHFATGWANLEVVVNRFENRLLGGVSEDAVAKALGRPVRWKVPEDRESANEKQLGETGVGDTCVSRLSQEIAGAITGRLVPRKKEKSFSLKGLGRSLAEKASGNDDPPSIKAVPPKRSRTTPDIRWSAPATITYGVALSSAQLNAIASAAGTLVYEPGPGSVLPKGTHKLSVSFTPADSEKYTVTQASVPLDVERSTPVIVWSKPDSIPYGAALGGGQLCATVSIPGTFDYSHAPGEVLAAGTHKLFVKFVPTDTKNYATVEAVVRLTVAKARPAIAWPAPNSIDFGTRLSARQLCATASVPGKFEYSPGPGVTPVAGMHTLTVKFTPTDIENYAAVEATVPLNVGKAAPVIAWSNPGPIPYGTQLGERQLCATASVPGKFNYSPAPGAVLAAGTHTLSVMFTPAEGAKYAAAQATTTLNVAKAKPILEWPALKPALFGTRLSSKQLCATASVPGIFNYSHAPGAVLAAGTHTLSVTFTPTDSANYETAQATVPFTVMAKTKATPAIAWPNPDPIPYGTPLGGEQLCATASVPGTFHYSAELGEELAAGTHALAVTFVPSDSENYAKAQAAVSLKVAKATPTIDWPAPEPILDGTLLSAEQLCATSPVAGRFDYSPFLGVALGRGTHTLSVVFTPADRANYATTQASVPLTVVAKPMPAIAWPEPATIPYGAILGSAQLCATASVPGRFDYSPAPGEVLPAGTHKLSVKFDPADTAKYATVEATVPLTVAKAEPAIAWAGSKLIDYGTELSARQLCATAPVPGRFEYSPGPGLVPAAGTHTLSATFMPTDSANYTAARATVSLEVARAIPNIAWPVPQSMQLDAALGDAQLCATSPVPGTFDYMPGPGHVLAAGTQTLSVTFTPTDTANYDTTQATVSIDVVAKPAAVSAWSDFDSVPSGTPLSSQHRATASVPGTFDGAAELGEAPAATQALSETFTQAKNASYAATQGAVSLNAGKASRGMDSPAPQPIAPVTPLCAVPPDAATPVLETFVASASADEVVPSGTQTLSAGIRTKPKTTKPARGRFGIFRRKGPNLAAALPGSPKEELVVALDALHLRYREDRWKQRMQQLPSYWPLAAGLILAAVAPQLQTIAAAIGNWSLDLIFPYVVLVNRPEIQAWPIAHILPTIMLYAQFPIEGLLARYILKPRVRLSTVTVQVLLFHYLGIAEILMISGSLRNTFGH